MAGSFDIAYWLPSVADLIKIGIALAGGAFIAIGITNRLNNKNKSRDDFIEKRIDDLVSEIRSAANLASDYWLVASQSVQTKVMEARINTSIKFVEEMRAALSKAVPNLREGEIITPARTFIREATGGDFGVHNRGQDADRAVRIQHAALRYITALRRTRLESHLS